MRDGGRAEFIAQRGRYTLERSRRGAWHVCIEGSSVGLAFDSEALASMVADGLAAARVSAVQETRLTPPRARALAAIRATDGVGMSSGMLAERLGVSPQQAANLCNELLAIGLVKRSNVSIRKGGGARYWWKAGPVW